MKARFFREIRLNHPEIRRLGTVLCDMAETTPVVFHGRLYRFGYFRSSELNEANTENVSHFRFIDVRTNAEENCFIADRLY